MFTTYCVGFCITAAILVIGFVFSWLIGITTNDDIDETIPNMYMVYPLKTNFRLIKYDISILTEHI